MQNRRLFTFNTLFSPSRSNLLSRTHSAHPGHYRNHQQPQSNDWLIFDVIARSIGTGIAFTTLLGITSAVEYYQGRNQSKIAEEEAPRPKSP